MYKLFSDVLKGIYKFFYYVGKGQVIVFSASSCAMYVCIKIWILHFQIVILDHQHFYDCDENDHHKLIESLEKIFGDKLLPYMNVKDMNSITLDFMHKEKHQVSV